LILKKKLKDYYDDLDILVKKLIEQEKLKNNTFLENEKAKQEKGPPWCELC